MTEEENKAIVLLTELRGLYEAKAYDYEYRGTLSIYVDEDDSDAIETILNLVEKQEEELKTEKHYAKVYENMVKDYEKICIEKNKRIEELEEEIDQMNKDKWEGWLEENE